jgi:hypothetical protein
MNDAESKTRTPDVLDYKKEGTPQATVRRHYKKWRLEQEPPLLDRCDIVDCFFHTNPMEWNGKPLKPIMDHIDGDRANNRTKNLRYLCPNCDSQQIDTRGGANKGRIERSEGGHVRIDRDGKRHYVLFAKTGYYSLTPDSSDKSGP